MSPTDALRPRADASAGPEPCTCFRLRRLSRRVTQRYDAELAAHGLSVGQFSLLAALRAGPAASLTALAVRLGTDRSTLSRTLRPLLDARLVEAAAPLPGDGDPRARAVRITDTGRDAWRAALPAWRRAQRALADALGEAPLAALHAAVDAADARLRTHPAFADAAPARPSAPEIRE